MLLSGFGWFSFHGQALYRLAVDELDLVPRDGVFLPVLAFSVADVAALCGLLQLAAFRAFCDNSKLELPK